MRLAVLAVALLAAGCSRKEEVRRYKAPKDPAWRTLAALAPGKDHTWFFKVSGPSDHVGSRREDVLAFARSLRSENGEIKWTTPAGWEETPGTGERLSTLRFGTVEPKLEMTVTRLPGTAGGALANVNRWRAQLGLQDLTDLSEVVRKIDASGLEVQFVDLVGPTRPVAGPRGMAAKPPEKPEGHGEVSLDRVRSMFTYELPQGWKENPKPEQGRVFEFEAGVGAGKPAIVTLNMFSGEGGGVAPNINRWRGQVGLDPLPDDEARAAARPFPFLGAEGWSVELLGKERALLCVFMLSEQFSIFLKMDGPPSVVFAQKAAFDRLALTFRLGGKHD